MIEKRHARQRRVAEEQGRGRRRRQPVDPRGQVEDDAELRDRQAPEEEPVPRDREDELLRGAMNRATIAVTARPAAIQP